MGRPCTICTHAQREAINQALAEGYSFRDVAAEYAVSKTALHRHWQAHFAVEPVSAPGAPVRASGTATTVKWGLWAVGNRFRIQNWLQHLRHPRRGHPFMLTGAGSVVADPFFSPG